MQEGKEARLSKLFNLMKSSSNSDYIGESISQLEHSLQAAKFAFDSKADDELIIAALLHDIGHICIPDAERMADLGVAHHEEIGAKYVQQLGFSERISDLIRGHVQAKRYLVASNEEYIRKLSPASLGTLMHQGGPMDAKERQQFERDPLFKEKLKMRFWDEKAKLVNYPVPPLSTYRDLLLRNMM